MVCDNGHSSLFLLRHRSVTSPSQDRRPLLGTGTVIYQSAPLSKSVVFNGLAGLLCDRLAQHNVDKKLAPSPIPAA